MSKAIIELIKLFATNKTFRKLVGTIAGVALFLVIIGFYIITRPWVIFSAGSIDSKLQPNLEQTQFIDQIAKNCNGSLKSYKLYSSLIIANAILKADWGNSELAQGYNNIYDLKADSTWTGQKAVVNSIDYREYESIDDSVKDYITYLQTNDKIKNSDVYNSKTYEEQAKALEKTGVDDTTDYAKTLTNIVKIYSLDRFDFDIIPTNQKFAFPCASATNVTSPFGYRHDPFTGVTKFHAGVDLSGDGCENTPVVSIADGVIDTIQTNDSVVGNAIRITHNIDGVLWYSRYCHLNKVFVSVTQNVLKGQEIGLLGNTGRSTGPHLHFEIYPNGQLANPVPYIFNQGGN